MNRRLFLIPVGIFAGLLIGIVIILYGIPYRNYAGSVQNQTQQKPQIIGFLPYWLLSKAKTDYASTLTMLTYFGLRIDNNGNLLKLINEQEEEPGWYALESGRLNPFLANAKKNHIVLSLLISNGDNNAIDSLLNEPLQNANNLIENVTPIMKQYGFKDLNLDIEYTKEASPEARKHFTQFVTEVKKEVNRNH